MNANEVWTWFLFGNILNSSNGRTPRKQREASNATEAPLQLLHQAQQQVPSEQLRLSRFISESWIAVEQSDSTFFPVISTTGS